MKYDLNNKHLVDFKECKDMVIENSLRMSDRPLKSKKAEKNRQLWEW